MIGDDWTEDQKAVAREMRMLGHDFNTIRALIGVEFASTVLIVCEARGWTVPIAQFEAECRRCTDAAVTAAAAELTNRGKTVERVGDLQLFRIDGVPMRAAALLDLAEAQHDR